jgi:hypothetical protein
MANWYRKGPVLGSSRRRRKGLWSLQMIALFAALGGSAWLWVDVIGGDIARGAHRDATHEEVEAAQKATDAATLAATRARRAAPGGPANAAPPLADFSRSDPVIQALLSTARDHLARKIQATVLPQDDPRASKGSSFDLVDRAVSERVPLRNALVRHRFREPRLYGLGGRPAATQEERRRAVTNENLTVLLQSFAESVPVLPGQRDGFEPGDIVMMERRVRGGRLLAAVVTDTVDDAQNPQVVTLDPADQMAREVSPFRDYVVRSHFRLRQEHLAKMRTALDLTDAPKPAGTAL